MIDRPQVFTLPDQRTNAERFQRYWPSETEDWSRTCGSEKSFKDGRDDVSLARMHRYADSRIWTWTGRNLLFLTDIHADADAFFNSLASVGAILLTDPDKGDFELLDRNTRYVIGGDCFDKGPDNLRLLEAIHQLYLKGADLVLLAGNHDVRTFLGFHYADSKEPLLSHLFARMGRKSVPLLKEIYDRFVKGQEEQPPMPDASIRDLLFPDENWHRNFRKATGDWLGPKGLTREIARVREKSVALERTARQAGMNLCQIHAAIQKFRELFFQPDGRYFWFFDKMKLAHREGSYLFVHGGVDDIVSEMILKQGIDGLNAEYKRVMASNPFELYYGPLGNVFLTRYRRGQDFDFTAKGVKHLHRAGLYAIVHGHKNTLHGQRMLIRKGMLNFECDASVDCNTRMTEGLDGPGGAVVIFSPDGTLSALSTDYPRIKTFHPGKVSIVTDCH